MLCPACGSSFSLSGSDATCTYRPGVQVLGHFELLQQVGAGRFGSCLESPRYAIAAHRGDQNSAAERILIRKKPKSFCAMPGRRRN